MEMKIEGTVEEIKKLFQTTNGSEEQAKITVSDLAKVLNYQSLDNLRQKGAATNH